MSSQFHIPSCPQLRQTIHSIWQVDRESYFQQEQIIPKGIVEIIFDFSEGASLPGRFGNRELVLPKCFINGFNKVPIRLQLPQRHKFFGVQLQPVAVKKLMGTPAHLFADQAVDVSLVDPEFYSLWHQLAEEKDFHKRISIVCQWPRIQNAGWHPQEVRLNEFLSSIHQHDISVTGLARELCYSARHLSRKIFEVTGMNTEEILLYKKYLHAVHQIHYSNLSLTKIAYQSNFSDQAHFIKAFKTYSGITPGAYSRNKSKLVGHLYENVR